MRSRRSKSKKRSSVLRTPQDSKRLRSRLNVSLIQKAKDAYRNNRINKLQKQLEQEIQKGNSLKAKLATMTKAEDRIDVLEHKIKQLKKKLSHKANVKKCYAKRLSKKREEKRSRRVGGK